MANRANQGHMHNVKHGSNPSRESTAPPAKSSETDDMKPTNAPPLSGTTSADLSRYDNPGKGSLGNGAGVLLPDIAPWLS